MSRGSERVDYKRNQACLVIDTLTRKQELHALQMREVSAASARSQVARPGFRPASREARAERGRDLTIESRGSSSSKI